jgi:hypothetical protein
MKFRLTYEGPLRPTQRDARKHEPDPIAAHKHAIRRHFHNQLKELWVANQFLRECKVDPRNFPKLAEPGSSTAAHYGNPPRLVPLVEIVADLHRSLGYRFVPLVVDRWELLCSLDILFLRRDIPGSALHAGDIDNRIKTLIDTLRMPRSPNELVGADETPAPGEDPFFCLLEDDRQVTRVSVETDTLLDYPAVKDEDKRKVRLIITVELKPYRVSMFNLSFA